MTFQIGDKVLFVDRDKATREGLIVCREFVDDPRRAPIGERFTIATADREVCEVPAARIGGKVGNNYRL